MVDIHALNLRFTHSLAKRQDVRSLPTQRSAPVPIASHHVPKGPLLQKHYTSFTATTTPCASPKASHQLRFYTRWSVLAAWTIHCWSKGPSRRSPARFFPGCLDPYPGCLSGALTRFFPLSFGLPATVTRSAAWQIPVLRLLYGP